jgi:hypothetical protein
VRSRDPSDRRAVSRRLKAKTTPFQVRTAVLQAELAATLERSRDLLWAARRGRCDVGLGAVVVAGASDAGVQDVIRDKLSRGLLPAERPLKLWVGRGNGRACDGCGLRIGPTHMEHEFDFPDGRTVRFHEDCTAMWRRALVSRAEHEQRPSPPGQDTIAAD